MNRRNFVKISSALASSSLIPVSAHPFERSTRRESTENQVDFVYDGIRLSHVESVQLLVKLVDEGKVNPDNYSNGGVVEELEESFAKQLGKESAIFMPTGTLANHIAVRELAKEKRKVIVQEQSHLYNDSGDCCQTLSNLNLIPLGKDVASFTIEEVEQAIAKTASGRVETNIGVIVIESPVRRKSDVMFGLDRIKTIAAFAKTNNVKMHMDGARLFVEAAHTGVSPSFYGQYFDTIYTSMYKCFNAPSGAILAGSKEFTEKLFHVRRMFGGGLPASWPFAAIALHYANYFEQDYRKSWENAELFFNEITKDGRFSLEKYENGTHQVRLFIKHSNLQGFRVRLSEQNVLISRPNEEGVRLKINPTMNRKDPVQLARIFINSLDQAN